MIDPWGFARRDIVPTESGTWSTLGILATMRFASIRREILRLGLYVRDGLLGCFHRMYWSTHECVELRQINTKADTTLRFWHYDERVAPPGGGISQWLDDALSRHSVKIFLYLVPPRKWNGAGGGYRKCFHVFLQVNLHWFPCHRLQFIASAKHVFEFIQ